MKVTLPISAPRSIDDFVTLRRRLHAAPELSREEFSTSALVADLLAVVDPVQPGLHRGGVVLGLGVEGDGGGDQQAAQGEHGGEPDSDAEVVHAAYEGLHNALQSPSDGRAGSLRGPSHHLSADGRCG